MGKATRWLRGLLGMKKEKENGSTGLCSGDRRMKKKWSFFKSEKSSCGSPVINSAWLKSFVAESDEKSKHAIVVAAATAAADAAVAAAQAAVAVVRLTSHSRGALFSSSSERFAAISIQSVFRGFLARKALRALKGLVKLQALVRGYLVRKRAAETLRSMEALIRAQVAVQAERASRSMNRQCRYKSMDKCESPKVVEVDTCRPRRVMSTFYMPEQGYGDDHQYDGCYLKPSSFSCRIPETRSNSRHFQNLNFGFVEEDYKCPTAQSTPRFASSGWVNGGGRPATPAKSVCGEGFFSGYSSYPSYMAETQSFRAKLRSQSAPKHRPESGTKRRMSLNEAMAARMSFTGARFRRVSCPGEVDAGVELLF